MPGFCSLFDWLLLKMNMSELHASKQDNKNVLVWYCVFFCFFHVIDAKNQCWICFLSGPCVSHHMMSGMTKLYDKTIRIFFLKNKHTYSVCLDPRFPPTSAFCIFFFFFFMRFGKTWLLFMYCLMNSNRKCWLFCRKQCIMYCSWTHKFYFFATFSLKMGLTVLFTHLKFILLQWF